MRDGGAPFSSAPFAFGWCTGATQRVLGFPPELDERHGIKPAVVLHLKKGRLLRPGAPHLRDPLVAWCAPAAGPV